MQLPQVIEHLSSVLRLPQMKQDEHGASGFRIHDIDIWLAPCPAPAPAFIVRACLGQIDVPDFAPLLESLVCANFFADGVGGPVFGIDAQAQVFLTQHFEEGSFSLVSMDACLSRFVAQACAGQELLAQARDAARAAEGVTA